MKPSYSNNYSYTSKKKIPYIVELHNCWYIKKIPRGEDIDIKKNGYDNNTILNIQYNKRKNNNKFHNSIYNTI